MDYDTYGSGAVELAIDLANADLEAIAFRRRMVDHGAIAVQQISDISAVQGPDTFVRPIYAGNALATVKSKDAIKVITVRTTAFAKADKEGGNGVVERGETAQRAGIAV